jgi:hypothetical protein
VEFRVAEVDPPEFTIVGGDTIFHWEGEPIQREDADIRMKLDMMMSVVAGKNSLRSVKWSNIL